MAVKKSSALWITKQLQQLEPVRSFYQLQEYLKSEHILTQNDFIRNLYPPNHFSFLEEEEDGECVTELTTSIGQKVSICIKNDGDPSRLEYIRRELMKLGEAIHGHDSSDALVQLIFENTLHMGYCDRKLIYVAMLWKEGEIIAAVCKVMRAVKQSFRKLISWDNLLIALHELKDASRFLTPVVLKKFPVLWEIYTRLRFYIGTGCFAKVSPISTAPVVKTKLVKVEEVVIDIFSHVLEIFGNEKVVEQVAKETTEFSKFCNENPEIIKDPRIIVLDIPNSTTDVSLLYARHNRILDIAKSIYKSNNEICLE